MPSHFDRFLTLWNNYPQNTAALLQTVAEIPRLPQDPEWPTAAQSPIPAELQQLPSDEAALKSALKEHLQRSKTEAAQVAGNWNLVLAKDDNLLAQLG